MIVRVRVVGLVLISMLLVLLFMEFLRLRRVVGLLMVVVGVLLSMLVVRVGLLMFILKLFEGFFYD